MPDNVKTSSSVGNSSLKQTAGTKPMVKETGETASHLQGSIQCYEETARTSSEMHDNNKSSSSIGNATLKQPDPNKPVVEETGKTASHLQNFMKNVHVPPALDDVTNEESTSVETVKLSTDKKEWYYYVCPHCGCSFVALSIAFSKYAKHDVCFLRVTQKIGKSSCPAIWQKFNSKVKSNSKLDFIADESNLGAAIKAFKETGREWGVLFFEAEEGNHCFNVFLEEDHLVFFDALNEEMFSVYQETDLQTVPIDGLSNSNHVQVFAIKESAMDEFSSECNLNNCLLNYSRNNHDSQFFVKRSLAWLSSETLENYKTSSSVGNSSLKKTNPTKPIGKETEKTASHLQISIQCSEETARTSKMADNVGPFLSIENNSLKQTAGTKPMVKETGETASHL
ncbi:uncharacterized protein LOC124455417 isoform X2 [Xenia sp. Carnegie-2017]|uniref:uncharacterized protein LOC124455417 isoform X2 n=1 Tax=Xenia sp. Carnegie-2017 TaxID=2897299 RepID=UPI001F039A7F|nr:uncharacterized protein LOC124455417 isoform X2 [Xenia sp. Carnegie-2017]